MKEITLKNYRCFRDAQSARLAPLTLLVGENSTGKTSFLALVQILSHLASGDQELDFKHAPFDLGSFDEIAHHRGARGGRAKTFEAGYSELRNEKGHKKDLATDTRTLNFDAEFQKLGTAAVPKRIRISTDDGLFLEIQGVKEVNIQFGTLNGQWEIAQSYKYNEFSPDWVPHLSFLLREARLAISTNRNNIELKSIKGKKYFVNQDRDALLELINYFWVRARQLKDPIFASAPIRSRPQRNYEPTLPYVDAEGDYIPTYLADMYFRNKKVWRSLENSLTDFGKRSGLFDEIIVKPLGTRESEPFQLQIRKFGKRLKGPPRNLIDVGYGVSQVLPIITELFQPDAPSIFLLQQPEVHLHPSAQAALGSLFCQIANDSRQLIVETHSDYILNRVRMDIRDKASDLKPEDVSVLYFERRNLGVKIHSLQFDQEGNVLGAPNGYRQFFLDEIRKSLGL